MYGLAYEWLEVDKEVMQATNHVVTRFASDLENLVFLKEMIPIDGRCPGFFRE